MDDLKTWLTGGSILGAVAIIGRWFVPILKRMIDNIADSVGARGDILEQVQAERDQWRKKYEELDAVLQKMRQEWADMKSEHKLMEYRLQQAETLASTLSSKVQELKVELQRYRQGE